MEDEPSIDSSAGDVSLEDTQEIDVQPLWTEADGEKTLYCPAANGFQEAEIKLPVSSPFTEEINSILHEHDGRPPLSIITVRETSPPPSFDGPYRFEIDETSYLKSVSIDTPDGEIRLARFDESDDPIHILYEARLTGYRSYKNPSELKERAKNLVSLIDSEYRYKDWFETEGDGSRVVTSYYLATEASLSQIDSVFVAWGTLGGGAQCVIR